MTRVSSATPFTVPKSSSATGPCGVRIAADDDGKTMWFNNQGAFWLYKKFVAANGGYYSPGMIGKMTDNKGNVVLDDSIPFNQEVDSGQPVYSVNNPAHGGAGGFGLHVARKNQYYPNTNPNDLANWTWETNTRYGMGFGLAGTAFGVQRVEAGTPSITNCVGTQTINVYVYENSHEAFKVVYKYTIRNNQVQQQITVVALGGAANLFVKEPKIVVCGLKGYKKAVVIDANSRPIQKIDMTSLPDPRCGTQQISAGGRAGFTFSGGTAAPLTVRMANQSGLASWANMADNTPPITEKVCGAYCTKLGKVIRRWEIPHFPSDPAKAPAKCWKPVKTIAASDHVTLTTAVDWGLQNGHSVRFRRKKGGPALPANISPNRTYFVINRDANDDTKFQVSTVKDGSALAINVDGTAVMSRAYDTDLAGVAGVFFHAWEGGAGYTDCLCCFRQQTVGASYVMTLVYTLGVGGSPPPNPSPPPPTPPPPPSPPPPPKPPPAANVDPNFAGPGLWFKQNELLDGIGPEDAASFAENHGFKWVTVQYANIGHNIDWTRVYNAFTQVGLPVGIWIAWNDLYPVGYPQARADNNYVNGVMSKWGGAKHMIIDTEVSVASEPFSPARFRSDHPGVSLGISVTGSSFPDPTLMDAWVAAGATAHPQAYMQGDGGTTTTSNYSPGCMFFEFWNGNGNLGGHGFDAARINLTVEFGTEKGSTKTAADYLASSPSPSRDLRSAISGGAGGYGIYTWGQMLYNSFADLTTLKAAGML